MTRQTCVAALAAVLAASCGGKGSGEEPDADADVEQEDVSDVAGEDVSDIAQDEVGDAEEEELPPTGTIETMTGRLPVPVGGITAVTDGTYAYILGGVTGPPPDTATDDIVRYDPSADAATTLTAALPQPTFITAAAWDGSDVYAFGGWAGSGLSDAVVRFDPGAGTVTTMTAVLPEPIGRTAVAWDGSAMVILGGNLGSFMPSGFSDLVATYTPSTDTLTESTSSLPSARASRIGAVECGSRILLFGGWGSSGKTDEIVEYDPGAGTVSVLAARLPVALDGGALACDGTRVYLFGGESDTATLDSIVLFDTATDEALLLDVRLPSPMRGHAAVWMAGAAYIFGGNAGTSLTDAILRFTPG